MNNETYYKGVLYLTDSIFHHQSCSVIVKKDRIEFFRPASRNSFLELFYYSCPGIGEIYGRGAKARMKISYNTDFYTVESSRDNLQRFQTAILAALTEMDPEV